MESGKDRFEQLVGLYKFWFGLFIQGNLASFSIAGALLSWVLNGHENSAVALVMPATICGSLGIGYVWPAYLKQMRLQTYVDNLCAECADVDIDYAPSFRAFAYALRIFGVCQMLVAAGCIGIACSVGKLPWEPVDSKAEKVVISVGDELNELILKCSCPQIQKR